MLTILDGPLITSIFKYKFHHHTSQLLPLDPVEVHGQLLVKYINYLKPLSVCDLKYTPFQAMQDLDIWQAAYMLFVVVQVRMVKQSCQ